MIPLYVLIAAIATFFVLMNGTLMIFPKDSRPAEFLMRIVYGVAVFFWVMAIFGTASVGAYITSGVITLLAVLIGQPKDNATILEDNEPKVALSTMQIGTEFDFPYIGKTGKIYCPSGEKGSYLGLLDETNDSILIYSDENFKPEEKFLIKKVENGKILVDKIEK